MKERWKPVVGWEGAYSVSSFGRVRSESRLKVRECLNRWGQLQRVEMTTQPKILKANKDSGGYMQVVLQRPGERITVIVHRLVLTAFRREPTSDDHGMHRNDVRDDNRLTNLKWGTRPENSKDMVSKGRRKGGGDGHQHVSPEARAAIQKRPNDKLADLAREFGTSKSNISKIRAKAKRNNDTYGFERPAHRGRPLRRHHP